MTTIKNNRLLVVDDNRVFADVLCDILKSKEVDATSCYAGEQAISLVKEDRYDYLLLDVLMPGMNGIKAMREIKTLSPETRVILMTGYSVDDEMRREINEANVDVVYKPFEIGAIINMLSGPVVG